MVFKPQKDLKEPKYKKLEIWNQGWETIDIGTPPTGNAVVKEIHQIQDEYRTATDEQKQQYINCDLDASYYIKQYMDCLLYTSPSPRDATLSRMPSSA